MDMPWLVDHFASCGGRSLGKAHPILGESESDSDSEGSLPELGGSDDGDDAVDALLAKRAELEETREEQGPNFLWTLRGGRWTAKHTGMAYDSFRAYAVAGNPATWCGLMSIVATATFSIRLYTEDGARMLADNWCHRMEFLYKFWQDSGEDP